MKTVEAKKAAENFPDYLSRVLTQKESFEILQGGVPCACLVPVSEPKCDSHELADDLASIELADEDRRFMAAALRRGRKSLKPLKNPWG